MRLWVALVVVLCLFTAHVAAAAHRINTTPADVISNITEYRYTNVTGSWGGANNNTTAPPNWGQLIWQDINVFPDFLGVELAWVLLFSIPFIMMWITKADMTAPGIVGIFLALFIFGYIGSQYAFLSLAMVGICVTAILWSAWQKVR